MYLNLYELKIPYRTKRLYYFNKDLDPKTFANNLTRVNNIRFITSNDLIWLEIPDLEFKIVPEQVEKYRISKFEIINEDEDSQLFIKTLYKFLRKKFVDNGFYFKKGNSFISINYYFPLESNNKINAHTTYKIKIHKINEKYYISILPKYTFLSNFPALESSVKSNYLFNIKSGKSFPYVSGIDNILKIDLGDKGIIEVSYPENYYFNFTSKEAEKLEFSKEIHQIYKEKLYGEYKKIPKILYFLNDIVEIKNPFNLNHENKIYINVEYNFKNNKSNNIKDIFKYSCYKNDQILNVLFFFSSKKQFFEVQNSMKMLFQNKNSIFYRTAKELGFSKINFVKDPKTNSSAFLYNSETFEVKNNEIFENIPENTMAIIILDKYLDNIDPLILNFPKRLILQPILKEKLEKMQAYIIKSYIYKMGNFSKNCKPYILEKMKDSLDNLYVGIDMSHDTYSKITNLCISGIDGKGDIIYIGKYKNLELNEKMNLDILEKEYNKIIDKYFEKNNKNPQNVFIIRDGNYIEDIRVLENIFSFYNIPYVLLEINKSTNINSYEDLKEWIIKLSENKYIYYPKTYLNQKGVEVNIIKNNSNYNNNKIIEQVYLLTRIVHPTPYANYKLPYPLHISNKVALTDSEWKLYIPYFEN